MPLIPLEIYRNLASFACSPLCLPEVCPGGKKSLFPEGNGPSINPYPVFFPIRHQHDQSNPSHPTPFLLSGSRIEYP